MQAECLLLQQIAGRGREVAAVTDQMEARVDMEYGMGEFLFREGDRISHVHCMHSGRVAITRTIDGHRSTVLYISLPGDMLGVPAIVDSTHHTTGARALEPTSVCRLPREAFLTIIEHCPEIAYEAMRRVCLRLSTLELDIEHRDVSDADP